MTSSSSMLPIATGSESRLKVEKALKAYQPLDDRLMEEHAMQKALMKYRIIAYSDILLFLIDVDTRSRKDRDSNRDFAHSN